MEREMNPQRNPTPITELPSGGSDLDEVRSKLEGILNAADKILDSLPATAAEDYLQQSRQRGGQ